MLMVDDELIGILNDDCWFHRKSIQIIVWF